MGAAEDLGRFGRATVSASPVCFDRLPEDVAERKEGLVTVLIDARFARTLEDFSLARLAIERRLCLERLWPELEYECCDVGVDTESEGSIS